MSPIRRGLQAERTELAWVRTALACAALTLLALRLSARHSSVTAAVVAAAAVGLTGAVAAAIRTRELRNPLPPTSPSRAGPALLAAAVCLADLLVLAVLMTD